MARARYPLTAVASDDSGATTTSGSRQVTIAASSNTPPTVTLTQPDERSHVRGTGGRISMAATAADMNGSITKVEFYAGSTLVSTDMSSPIQCNVEQLDGWDLHRSPRRRSTTPERRQSRAV